ncbi:hypothetical protein LCGC14_1021900 [marine sediment metagenome]|uniref:Uncharacterized protein n=1 Tax=marine sediment metagenome TaxID=412755 RepID=A0A0F9QFA7_9ZZZZ
MHIAYNCNKLDAFSNNEESYYSEVTYDGSGFIFMIRQSLIEADGLTGPERRYVEIVESILEYCHDPDLHIHEVQLIIPPHLSPIGRTQMVEIAAIFSAEEPYLQATRPAYIYTLCDGQSFIDSSFGTSERYLRNRTKLMAFDMAHYDE